jgi:hypothetical protein
MIPILLCLPTLLYCPQILSSLPLAPGAADASIAADAEKLILELVGGLCQEKEYVRRQATRYSMRGGELFKKTVRGQAMKSIDKAEVEVLLLEIS